MPVTTRLVVVAVPSTVRPVRVDDAVAISPPLNVDSVVNVMFESNVAASSSFTSVLSEMRVWSSENESSDVVDIFSLNTFQSTAVRHL